MDFEWDTGKDEATRRERNISLRSGVAIFAGRVVEWEDRRRDYGETRMRAVGQVGEAILHVVYTDRGQTRRIISVRIASRKERQLWLSRA